jgi:putative hydroxymethylpyrimidine transporter CytX
MATTVHEELPGSSAGHGIEPVEPHLRTLSFFDNAALWGNLGISLLLPIVAAFLVPALSLQSALLAIVIGVVIGNAMLGYAAAIGARTGAPAMVLYRPSLGRRGSYLPTVLNVAQNIGWGAFELLIIGHAAAAISERLFGAEARWAWTLAFGVLVTLMAVGGPILVVRRWIGRYAVWLVIASTIYLTVYVLGKVSFGDLFDAPGQGMPFWTGVDLVVAMPISWIPLAADYTRFARTPRAGGAGAAIGYGIAHAWFYVLGVLLIAAEIATDPADPTGFVIAVMAVPAGLLALGILAVDESDEAFANIYSASVSIQNAFPKASQRTLSIGIGALCTILAIAIPLVQYENFLLLIGAVFIPLFGVLAAHHGVVARGYTRDDLYASRGGVRAWGIVAWLVGFAAYNWLNPGTVSWWVSAMGSVFGTDRHPPTWLSASLFAFGLSFVIQAAERLRRR